MMGLYRFLSGTLRGRLILGVAAVHALMMTLFVVDLTARQRAMLLERQVAEATALTQALATSCAGWIAARDISGLQEQVDGLRRYPEVQFAMLADHEGRVLAAIDRKKSGLYLLDLPREARQKVLSSNPALVDIAVPAAIGGRQVGWARVGLGQKAAGQRLAEITRSGVRYALAAILIGSAIAWFMGCRITRRLYAVQQTINAVRSGDSLARSPIAGSDEACVLAREFNAMLDALAERDTKLRASEKRYQSLIRKVQAAILLHDGQGRILDSNPLAQELLGLSADQLLGKTLIDPNWHFLREDGSALPVAEYPVSQVLSRRQPVRGKVAGVNRPDRDEVIWMLVNADPEYDVAGEIALVIVSFVDITQQKRDEQRLHRLNRELRAVGICNQVLVRAVDEQAMLDDICRIICDEAGYRMAWVGYAENDEARTVRPVSWGGAELGYLTDARITWADSEHGSGPSGTAIRTGETDCIQDLALEPKASRWREQALQRGYRSSIALPMKDEAGHTFGALAVYATTANDFTPDEIRLLEEMSGNLAFGILFLRARKERELAEEALHRLTAELEQRVAERTAELNAKNEDLERTVRLFVGRELRMVQLKEQVKALEQKAALERKQGETRCPR